jgi:hypothetical protein
MPYGHVENIYNTIGTIFLYTIDTKKTFTIKDTDTLSRESFEL